jgi:hypothetical protein
MLFKQNRRRVVFLHYTPWWTWTGTEAERICLRLQLAALSEMEAPVDLQRYVTALLARPTYHRQWIRFW